MNKILRFTMVAALALVSTITFAQTTVTFTAGTDKGSDGGTAAKDVSITKDGITIHATNTSGNAGVFGRTDQYRFYKGATVEFSSTVGNITKVVINSTASGDAQYGPGCFTDASTGTYNVDDKVGTWTGNAASFTLTASKAQVRATSIEVTYTAGGTTPTTLSAPKITADKTFSESTTVTITADEGATVYYTLDGQDPDDREGTEYKAPFTIDATTTVKAIAYKGDLQSTVASETFTKVVTENAADIAAFKALAKGTYAVLTLKDAQVVYTWTSNNGNTSTYVRDASGALDLYNTGLDLKANDVLNGTVNLTRDDYNNLIQAVKNNNTKADNLTITAGEAAQPKVITVADAASNVSDLVVINDVNIVADGKRFYAVSGNDRLQVYNGFHLDGYEVAAAENVSIKGIITQYNSTYEIQPIEAPVAAGINSIKADTKTLDANAPMFNLAGQRVNKDFKGVVIQNGRKVILK